MSKPNIIVIMTDQQRFDTIAALGYPWMKTPNLDRLAHEGAILTQTFCAAPSCVPSRCSFFNGQYPHNIGVFSNHDPWEHSWVENLRDAGYLTVNIGKMHTGPATAECGFHQRFIVENKDRTYDNEKYRFFDEWDKFLLFNSQEKPTRDSYQSGYPGYAHALGAYEWPLDEEYHSDEFVGNMAVQYIMEVSAEEPLFLQIGFPGPHPPYDPPQRYIDMYCNVDILLPCVLEEELANQPPCHGIYRQETIDGNHDGVKWKHHPSKEELLRLRRYYAANMTLIDEKIGGIISALSTRGFLENAIIYFTSDHGDCLGDHGHIQKWNMYDESLRVPSILWSKDRIPAGTTHTALTQQMDVADYLLKEAKIPVPLKWDAQELRLGENHGRDYVYAEHAKDNVWYGSSFMSMVRSNTHKLVFYPEEKYGELYDLVKNPTETINEWDNPLYASIRSDLTQQLLKFRPAVQ